MVITQINLLPWREERRQDAKKKFLTTLAITAVFAGVIVVLINFQNQAKI
jgi:type IV pilus assembly protein PilN